MADSPLAPLSKLTKRLRDEMKEMGLSVQQFLVMPSANPDDPPRCQAIVIMDEDRPKLEVQVDKGLDESLKKTREAEDKAKAEQSRKELESLKDDLKNPRRGLGLD